MIKVMKFSADWCGPCKRLKPIWESIASDVKDVDFVVVDIDKDPDMAAQFAIQSIPTMVFLKDGIEAGRLVGLVKESVIRDVIEKLK